MQTQSLKHVSLSIKTAIFTAIVIAFSGCSSDRTERALVSSATYKVTFTTFWSAATFPTNFPAGAAHFSGLIGGTHNNQVKFWEVGQIASVGIENMAETGAKVSLSAEVEIAKDEGKAQFVLSGSGNTSSGSVDLEFDINEDYPLVSLVSMVAPSPDWFVGVRDLSLFDDSAGDWKQTVVVDLRVYDAGTDSGMSFASLDIDSQPADPTLRLSTTPAETDFVDGVGPNSAFIASMRFERIN